MHKSQKKTVPKCSVTIVQTCVNRENAAKVKYDQEMKFPVQQGKDGEENTWYTKPNASHKCHQSMPSAVMALISFPSQCPHDH